MDKDFALLLAGASIALVSSIITALMQHYFSLRSDRIRRERDVRQQRTDELREAFQRLASPKIQPKIAAVSDEHLVKAVDVFLKRFLDQADAESESYGERHQ